MRSDGTAGKRLVSRRSSRCQWPDASFSQWDKRTGSNIGVVSRLLVHSDSTNAAYTFYTSGLRTFNFAGIRAGEVAFGNREELEVRDLGQRVLLRFLISVVPQRARGVTLFDRPAIKLRAQRIAQIEKAREADASSDEEVPQKKGDGRLKLARGKKTNAKEDAEIEKRTNVSNRANLTSLPATDLLIIGHARSPPSLGSMAVSSREAGGRHPEKSERICNLPDQTSGGHE